MADSLFLQIKAELNSKTLPTGPLVHVLNNKLYTDGLIVELGTGEGKTAELISSKLSAGRKLDTFDWFYGRPEHWRVGYGQGEGNRGGKPPLLPHNVIIHTGKFSATLSRFVKKNKKKKIALLYVDCDLYSSTITGLTTLAPLIRSGTVIVFDEFINYPSYENHEFKAFLEFLKKKQKEYEVIGMKGHPDVYNGENWRIQKAAFRIYNKGEKRDKAKPVLVRSTTVSLAARALPVLRAVKAVSSLPNIIRDVVETLRVDNVKLIVAYGRERYFECLLPYILRELDQFTEVIIWKNTKNVADLKFLDGLLDELKKKGGLDEKFNPVHPKNPNGKRSGVYPLYSLCNDDNTLYIKMDDDIVWVAENGFAELIKFAKANVHRYCLVSANVVNSGPLDAVHQGNEASAIDPVEIKGSDPYKTLMTLAGVKHVHTSLQKAIEKKDISKYLADHTYINNERWSINCIAFFGNLFNKNDHVRLLHDDEYYISRKLATVKNKKTAVAGKALMAHYAFSEQRRGKKVGVPGINRRRVDQFDIEGHILAQYREWAYDIV